MTSMAENCIKQKELQTLFIHFFRLSSLVIFLIRPKPTRGLTATTCNYVHADMVVLYNVGDADDDDDDGISNRGHHYDLVKRKGKSNLINSLARLSLYINARDISRPVMAL